jgi:hypothetical protein
MYVLWQEKSACREFSKDFLCLINSMTVHVRVKMEQGRERRREERCDDAELHQNKQQSSKYFPCYNRKGTKDKGRKLISSW